MTDIAQATASVDRRPHLSVTEEPTSFLIQRITDGARVRIELQPTCLAAEISDGKGGAVREVFGFYQYYRLFQTVAEVWMRNWQPPAQSRAAWSGVRDWAEHQTAEAVCRHMHAPWRRLLESANPEVLGVHRAVFAATLSTARLSFCEELYHNEHLVHDITHYRAAAIALQRIDQLGGRVNVPVTAPSPAKVRRALARLQNWQGLFAPQGKPYRSLSRTLMNLPGGVPPALVCRLSQLCLPRPLLTRLEFIVALLAAGVERNQRVFLFARPQEIRRALQLVAAHTQNKLSPRRTSDLAFLVDFLRECPDEHRSNIVGLAEKASAGTGSYTPLHALGLPKGLIRPSHRKLQSRVPLWPCRNMRASGFSPQLGIFVRKG